MAGIVTGDLNMDKRFIASEILKIAKELVAVELEGGHEPERCSQCGLGTEYRTVAVKSRPLCPKCAKGWEFRKTGPAKKPFNTGDRVYGL